MAKTNSYPPISITAPKKEFDDFLADTENRRIIFSGAFGSGKTYFLKNFFGDKEKYHYIRLAPVNYSVSKSEDIFELIKFDILFQILKEGVLPAELKFSNLELLQTLSILDPEKGIRGILEKTSHTSHDVFQFPFEQIKTLLKKQDNAAEASSLEKLRQFLTKHEQQAGSPKEQDVITKLIYCLVSLIGQPDKQTVLVIDDLDRIDPEHIFRILNVFAAHFDLDDSENANKFGFDRMVVVCDIQNVRRMFRNRYGQDTDFSGYIDKFYSRRIFQFDNRKAVEDAVSGILCSMEIEPRWDVFPINNRQGGYHAFLVFVLHGMIKTGVLNLRSIWKMRGQKFVFEAKRLNPDSFYYCSTINLFDVLSMILGDSESLHEGLQRCVLSKIGLENSQYRDKDNKHKLGFVLPILSTKNEGQELQKYLLPGVDEETSFTLHGSGERGEDIWAKVQSVTKNGNEITPDIFPYLVEALDVLRRLGLSK